MRFVDANIFIKWMAASRRKLTLEAAIAGYIIKRIRDGEMALTTTLVKDEVLIWLSRYKASALPKFIQAIRNLVNLEIVSPTLNDEEYAAKMYGKFPLDFSDLVNLAVMKRLGISEIYTIDKGFLKADIKVVFWDLKNELDFRKFVEELKHNGFIIDFSL